MLDAKTAFALNKIIRNSQFKKKVSLEEQKAQKEDRFVRGRQIAYMIYDNFRVNGAHDTVLDYADLFTLTLRNDDVQELDTRWDEILLSMSKIPLDDYIAPLCHVRHLEKVFWNVRQRYGLSPEDKSSSWERSFRDFTFHQELNLAIIETLVS